MNKKTIIALLCTALLIIWQSRIIKKQIADLSGPFNEIITVCIKSIPTSTDIIFKHAGAHFKYERFIPFSGSMQKQVCYVKLKHDQSKNNEYAGRYQYLNSSETSQAGFKPCKLFFNDNLLLKEQYENVDNSAIVSETLHDAVKKLKNN